MTGNAFDGTKGPTVPKVRLKYAKKGKDLWRLNRSSTSPGALASLQKGIGNLS